MTRPLNIYFSGINVSGGLPHATRNLALHICGVNSCCVLREEPVTAFVCKESKYSRKARMKRTAEEEKEDKKDE